MSELSGIVLSFIYKYLSSVVSVENVIKMAGPIPQGVGSLQVTEDDVIGHSIDMFSSAPREIAMLAGDEVAYRPEQLNQDGPYTFNIPTQGNRGLLLNTARLEVKINFFKENGTILDENSNVGVINNFAGSFVNKIDILLDGNEVSALSNTHHSYKHYVETLLSYGFSAEFSHLQAGCWFQDAAGRYNSTSEDSKDTTADKALQNVENRGYQQRKLLTAKSQMFTAIGPLSSDIMQVDKMFPMGYPLAIRIARSPDDFLLMKEDSSTVSTNYKISVEGLRLFICHIALSLSKQLLEFSTIYLLSQ